MAKQVKTVDEILKLTTGFIGSHSEYIKAISQAKASLRQMIEGLEKGERKDPYFPGVVCPADKDNVIYNQAISDVLALFKGKD